MEVAYTFEKLRQNYAHNDHGPINIEVLDKFAFQIDSHDIAQLISISNDKRTMIFQLILQTWTSMTYLPCMDLLFLSTVIEEWISGRYREQFQMMRHAM